MPDPVVAPAPAAAPTPAPTPAPVAAPAMPDAPAALNTPVVPAVDPAAAPLAIPAGDPAPLPDGNTADGAPEQYADFSVPEGVPIDAETLAEFTPLAKELGLSQDAAQKVVDLQARLHVKATEAFVEQIKQWDQDLVAHPTLGGEKLPGTLQVVRGVMARFATPELMKALDLVGYTRNVPLVEFVHRVGKALGESQLAGGSAGGGATDRGSELAKMYPKMVDADGNLRTS